MSELKTMKHHPDHPEMIPLVIDAVGASMDVKREESSGLRHNRKILILTGFIISVLFIGWQFTQPEAARKVSKEDVWFGEVQSGELQLQVAGYGKLQSKVQRLLTARVKGLVEEILLRPGASVTEESIILRLWNPELDQQVVNETLQLKTEQANLRQQTLNLRREFLAQKAQLALLEANYNTANFNLDAMTQLVGKGVVSQLDYKRAQLEENQLKTRSEIEQERLRQLSFLHVESINIQKEKINLQQGKLNAVIEKQRLLLVRSGIKGVLQTLPVELGQSVSEGELLAFVGGTEKLIAHINVPQTQIDQIQVGHTVDVDTRGGLVSGQVIRIDPVVNAGTVLIEVELSGQLPGNARPELTVDAIVHVGKLEGALYIERPVNVQAGSTATLFRVLRGKDQAEAVKVTFGMEAGALIQIVAGANLGDQFILSDTKRWQKESLIILD